MKIRFQADADLDGRILRGLKGRSRDIDISTAASAGFAGLKDPEVLRLSAEDRRILVSQDRRTMPTHFAEYVANANSSGVILLREAISLAGAIEELVLIWTASEAEEWINRLAWIPLRGIRGQAGDKIGGKPSLLCVPLLETGLAALAEQAVGIDCSHTSGCEVAGEHCNRDQTKRDGCKRGSIERRYADQQAL